MIEICEYILLFTGIVTSYSFIFVISKRHDNSIKYIFYLFGSWIFVRSFCFRFDNYYLLLMSSIFSIIVSYILLYQYPSLSKIPSVKDIYDKHLETKKMLREAVQRVIEISKENPEEARKRLKLITDFLKEI